MLVGFVGCPSSGKTTTAALIFAQLKKMGLATEFIPEQARFYIAQKRVINHLTPSDPVKLSDTDQAAIMKMQVEWESTLLESCGKSVIVLTDSASYLSLVYMEKPDLLIPALKQIHPYNVLFYCPPLPYANVKDPNRIHSQGQALEVDSKIKQLMPKYFPEVKLIPLVGSPEERADLAIEIIGNYEAK